MAGKSNGVLRRSGAPEPAGPTDLPSFERWGHAGRGALRLRLSSKQAGRWAAAGGCLLLQLLVVGAVYQGHSRHITPRLQQGLDRAVEPRRGRLLEQPQAGAMALGQAPSLSGCAASCANCSGVRLAEADQQLLWDEIERMARSLSDGRVWPLGAPDATAAAELRDKVVRGEGFKPSGAAVQRVVDEAFGPQSVTNVPGVEDVHAELAKYNSDLVAATTLSVEDAAARQHRATAAELGLAPVDGMAELGSLARRVDFLNRLAAEVQAREALRVCVAATTSADLWGVRREVLPWLQYHTELGVTRFYLLYDGADAQAVALLSRIPHVRLLHLHAPWASAQEAAAFEFYARQAKQWGGQPGNYELMVKQGYGQQEALRLAEADGMQWLLHIDPDELLHPGGPSASITAVLGRLPPHVPAVRFMNFEGQPEAGDLTNRFEQVTLFRVHKHFITPEAHFYRQKYKLGDNAVFLTLYANGKSAVRVGVGARQLGPHFFAGDPSPRWKTQENPRGEWRDVVSDDTVVLHYAYSYISDVEAKANRSCPASYLEAARRGDRSQLKACFVIDFDQDAYLAAAAGRAAVEDFFYSRMVLSEGSRIKCRNPESGNAEGWCTLTNIDRFKYLMQKIGLMKRIHGPQLILRLHERAIQAMAGAEGIGSNVFSKAA